MSFVAFCTKIRDALTQRIAEPEHMTDSYPDPPLGSINPFMPSDRKSLIVSAKLPDYSLESRLEKLEAKVAVMEKQAATSGD